MTILDTNLDNWVKSTTGTGSITIENNGDSARCVADGVSAAVLRKSFFCQEGDVVELSIYARRVSGATETDGGQLRLDWYNAGAETYIKDVEILSRNWKKYTLTLTREAGDGYGNILAFGVGWNTSKSGELEFTEPVLSINGSKPNEERILALGVIDFEGGGGNPRFKPTYHKIGFDSVSIDGSGYTTLTMRKPLQYRATNGVDSSSRDVFPMVNISHERYGNVSEILPLLFVNTDGDDGSLLIRPIESGGAYVSNPALLVQHRYTIKITI